jgi:head-tail adaptor
MFKPNIQQMATPIRIQHRTETIVNGAPEISYADADPALDFCNWKGKGGTESTQSGSLVVFDTAELTMWYRPDITPRDRILLNDDPGFAYEVINVENVEMRNKYLVLKVQRAVNA